MFLKFVGIIALIALGTETSSENIELAPQIVNGTDAHIAEFPFLVSLQSIRNETHSLHSCGGSILNDYWILTVSYKLYLV